MRIRRTTCILLAWGLVSISFVESAIAQTPAKPPVKAAAGSQVVEANLLQLMRGTLYPASNVVFAAQEDFSKQPVPPDASTSPNPLTTTYGGWTAVENAALALSESANLLLLPGRM